MKLNTSPKDFNNGRLSKWLIPDTCLRLYDFDERPEKDSCHSTRDFNSTTSQERRLIRRIQTNGRLVINSFEYI